MTRAAPTQIARWASAAGWRLPNLQVAVATGIAQGGDPAKAGGVWGVGGPPGDGAGQATAAHAQWKTQGWDEFPSYRSGAWRLYIPTAIAAITAANVEAVASLPGEAVGGAVESATAAIGGPLGPALAIAEYVSMEEFWNRAIKVGLGVTLLAISATMITWGTVMRPFFRAVGVVDRKIAQQADLARTP